MKGSSKKVAPKVKGKSTLDVDRLYKCNECKEKFPQLFLKIVDKERTWVCTSCFDKETK